jgi:hypothetical protein
VERKIIAAECSIREQNTTKVHVTSMNNFHLNVGYNTLRVSKFSDRVGLDVLHRNYCGIRPCIQLRLGPGTESKRKEDWRVYLEGLFGGLTFEYL